MYWCFLFEKRLCFLVSDDEMNHAVRRGNEEAVEIFAQLFDLIAPCDSVHL